ncbi:MAG: hypothetical protein JWP88_948 [Flaviaesturariibacter sp.]|nr:hypothetical protein [Flaviaesturariibacter sp.]
MRKRFLFLGLLFLSVATHAQKIENIYFNLYTDSLKKGFYNYINVDGKTSDERWLPLDSTKIILTTNGGTFTGNNLFIDSSYKGETVKVKAVLRSNPSIWQETVIYIRKRGFDEPLKSSEELLDDMKKQKTKVKKKD